MVLNSRAMLSFFYGEPGADQVAVALEQPCLLSALSALELAQAMPQVSARELSANLRQLGVEIIPLEGPHALELGRLSGAELEAALMHGIAKHRGHQVFDFKTQP